MPGTVQQSEVINLIIKYMLIYNCPQTKPTGSLLQMMHVAGWFMWDILYNFCYFPHTWPISLPTLWFPFGFCILEFPHFGSMTQSELQLALTPNVPESTLFGVYVCIKKSLTANPSSLSVVSLLQWECTLNCIYRHTHIPIGSQLDMEFSASQLL